MLFLHHIDHNEQLELVYPNNVDVIYTNRLVYPMFYNLLIDVNEVRRVKFRDPFDANEWMNRSMWKCYVYWQRIRQIDW